MNHLAHNAEDRGSEGGGRRFGLYPSPIFGRL